LVEVLHGVSYTREVAKVIMDSGEWMRSLRTSNVIDRVANTPFRRMIRKMPGLALLTLEGM
jgi:hypothetical protein